MRDSLGSEGHRFGGPRHIGVLLAVLAFAGCGGMGGSGSPSPDERLPIVRPADVYRQLGLIAGGQNFPVVASFATLAGPADSTYVVFALSMPSTALRFRRADRGFTSEYTVELAFVQDSQTVRRISRHENVRVGGFTETGRTDESIVFQTLVAIPPGEYVLEIDVRDEFSARGLEARDTVVVPAYGASSERITPPLLVYSSDGRGSRAAAPELIVNPRHTVYYGTGTPHIYLEGYGISGRWPVRLRVVDEQDSERWSTRVSFIGTGSDAGAESDLWHATVAIPTGTLPLGKMWIEVVLPGDTVPLHRVPIVVTISDQWMIANFEDVFEFLSYIASPAELDSIRNVTGAERQRRWREFWERRDPLPATPANEFRDSFFERVRTATVEFNEPGVPGWRTDRGRVFILLGPPDRVLERRANRNDVGQEEIIFWLYQNTAGGRLELVFRDRNGFGRYEMTPASEAAFRRAAQRVREALKS